MDSILRKEVDLKDYTLRNFSELIEKSEYPNDLISLAFPNLYADLDEYYAAFLYRERFHNDLDFINLNQTTLKHYTKLRKLISKGIVSNSIGSPKELKLLAKLQSLINQYPPPVIGYIQYAQIEYIYLQRTSVTNFEIHYNLNFGVENFGIR